MGRGLYITVAGFYAPAVIATLIAELFRGGPGDEDDDGEYLDDWMMSVFGFGVMRNATAFVPVLGQVTNSAIARFNSNPLDDRMSLSPAISLIEGSAGVPYHLYKMAVDEGNAQRTVKDVATLISVTTGLPASAAARPIGYIAGGMQGKIEPTSEADMVRGLVSGVASKESRVY